MMMQKNQFAKFRKGRFGQTFICENCGKRTRDTQGYDLSS
jgi:hypothetical protein